MIDIRQNGRHGSDDTEDCTEEDGDDRGDDVTPAPVFGVRGGVENEGIHRTCGGRYPGDWWGIVDHQPWRLNLAPIGRKWIGVVLHLVISLVHPGRKQVDGELV